MFQRRLGVIYLVICAGIFLIGIKLFSLQVLQIVDEDPDAVLYRQTPWEKIPATRGRLLDRHGEVLVEDRPVLELALKYDKLLEPEEWLKEICRLTGKSETEILARRNAIVRRVSAIHNRVGKKVYEETIAHTLVSGIGTETAILAECNPERFPSVVIRTALERCYLRADFAPHVMGSMGFAQHPAPGEVPEDPYVSPGDRIGITGVERQFNQLLRGVPGSAKEGLDRKTGIRTRRLLFAAQKGYSLYLTLDRPAQDQAERLLANQSGGIVVMDVHTGEVLVLASTPTFDVTRYGDYLHSPDRALRSRPLQEGVATGSTIKPFVALAAALVDKTFGAESVYRCSGYIDLGGTKFRCSARNGHGQLALQEAIAHSCNVYFFELGRRIGAKPIVDLADKMGFGKCTGIELPWESSGYLQRPEQAGRRNRPWYGGDTLNLCIGQGNLQVTPLQLTVGMAAIANGGKVLQPRIIRRVEPVPDPEFMPALQPVILREVDLRSDVLRAIQTGMRGAVTHGTASAANIRRLVDLQAAVKTGTAQTGNPRINHAWMAGFVPYNAPRYAFAAVVQNTPLHGAEAAGPVAVGVLETLLTREQ